MPVLASSAYRPVNQITALVRAILNDQQGATFTDAFLMPFVAAAYRKVQQKLANSGQTTFITDEALLVVAALPSADPSVQASITDATAAPNQLPVDLISPSALWERPSGSSDNFVPMVDCTEHGGLPSQPQGQSLVYWEWRSDGLYFIGALQATQIRLRYMKAMVDPTDANSQILIRAAINAVSFVAAALAAESRGGPQAKDLDALATDALFDLANASARRSQHTGRRRRPFSSRRTW